jgi:hypothetical protein
MPNLHRTSKRQGGTPKMNNLIKYEQETIINFNAGEQTATVYTRDRAVMRKLDTLVIEFPDVYKLINETEYDRTYEMPKLYVKYRKPRHLSDEQREKARQRIKKVNGIR